MDARTEYGDTALNLAAQGGHKKIVERLLQAGANIENVGGTDMTPLMIAAVAGNVGMVRVLLARGARISDGTIANVHLKVGILKENAENGMVRADAVEAWRNFLTYLIETHREQARSKAPEAD